MLITALLWPELLAVSLEMLTDKILLIKNAPGISEVVITAETLKPQTNKIPDLMKLFRYNYDFIISRFDCIDIKLPLEMEHCHDEFWRNCQNYLAISQPHVLYNSTQGNCKAAELSQLICMIPNG